MLGGTNAQYRARSEARQASLAEQAGHDGVPDGATGGFDLGGVLAGVPAASPSVQVPSQPAWPFTADARRTPSPSPARAATARSACSRACSTPARRAPGILAPPDAASTTP